MILFFYGHKKNIEFMLRGARLILDTVWISFINILILLSIFSENIRSNIITLFSTLIENGVMGFYVISILIYLSRDVFKLWFYIFKYKAINIEVFKKALLQSQLEKK